MKKNYKKLAAFIVLLCALTNPMVAALSGVYTINFGAGTSGSNFQTFTAFAQAVTSQGVSGPVTVNVTSGTYNEQPIFGAIAGASSINKITINGNGALLTFASNNSGAVSTICFNGADYIELNNLNVMANGSSYATAIQLCGGANNNTINNCTFSCTPNTTNYYAQVVLLNGAPGPYYMSGTVNQNNTFTGCQMFSGYTSVYVQGQGTALNQMHTGLNFYNCSFEDFYQYGIYAYYNGRCTWKNNEFSQKTRTTLTGVYAMYLIYTPGGLIIDGNKINKMWTTQPNGSHSLYAGIMIQDPMNPQPSGWTRHEIKNNIISDIRGNGYHYGFYFYYTDADVVNNTISFDDPNSTSGQSTGISHYGLSGYGTTNYRSNLISIQRGGSSTAYGFYLQNTTELSVENNNIFVSTGSNKYIGYNANNGTTYATHAAWKLAGYDATGYNFNPNFVNIQSDLHPTNTNLNNLSVVNGLLFDQENAVRHATTPDIGALEFLTPVCSGTPGQTVTGPTYALCPGETAKFTIGNLSSDLGWTYQWQYSTQSNVGLWTVVAGAKGIQYSQPNVQQTTWVSAMITCTAPGGQSVTAVAQVNVAGVTTNTAPYFEDFENIGINNRLPNCSWTSPQLGGTTKTYIQSGPGNLLPKSGSSFASFNNSTPGTSYYYTNQIYMYAGITYSGSVWFQTDLTGAANWTNLSILYGPNQSAAGLTQIASTGGPAISPFYKALSNTFQVSNSGYYYVAVRATSTGGVAQNLSFDDLRIEIPCSLNSPTVALAASNTTICAGEQVVITASGADDYVWNNGELTSAITVSPQVSTTYVVIGSSALSGCGSTMMQNIIVNPSPVVIAVASSPSICCGKSVVLTAGGAQTYAWSNGGFGPSIQMTPACTGPATVQVIGTNQYNCATVANVVVGIHTNPTVFAAVNNNLICAGDAVVFTGSGANSYSWLTTNNFNLSGSPITNIPSGTGTYTLTGIDANGCTGTSMVSVAVEPCLGLSSVSAADGLKVFPNPTSGDFTVEMNSGLNKMIDVTDVTGRVILSGSTDEASFNVNINQLAGGVYYVKVTSGSAVNVIKVIKQ